MESHRHQGVIRQPAAGRREGGFTLVEVLIAVVVLSTGIVLILQGMHSMLAVWDGAADHLRSVMLAREKLEEVRIAAVQHGECPLGGTGRFEAPFTRYHWQVEVDRPRLPVRVGPVPGGEGGDGLHGWRCTVWRQDSDRDFRLATLVYVPPAPAGEEGEP